MHDVPNTESVVIRALVEVPSIPQPVVLVSNDGFVTRLVLVVLDAGAEELYDDTAFGTAAIGELIDINCVPSHTYPVFAISTSPPTSMDSAYLLI